MSLLEKNLKTMETENSYIFSLQPSAESMIQPISEFHHEPESDQTFINWF